MLGRFLNIDSFCAWAIFVLVIIIAVFGNIIVIIITLIITISCAIIILINGAEDTYRNYKNDARQSAFRHW